MSRPLTIAELTVLAKAIGDRKASARGVSDILPRDLLATGDDVKAYADRVNGFVQSLQGDASRAGQKDSAIFAGWAGFVGEWTSYYQDVKSRFLWLPGTTVTAWDQVAQYDATAQGWREKIAKTLGGDAALKSPPPPVDPASGKPSLAPIDPPKSPDSGGFGIPWTAILLVGGFATAGYFLSQIATLGRMVPQRSQAAPVSKPRKSKG